MKLQKLAGATSEIWQVFIRDSSSTTGAGLTGLTNASGSLTAYYHRDTDTTATAISLVSMTVGTFTSSGFKEIDATNMPGWYQFCPPNAALASGAKSVGFHLKGASNMAPLPIEVQLTAVNPDSATAFVTSVVAASVASGGISTASFAAGAINATAIATDAIGSAQLAASAANEIAAAAGVVTGLTADSGTTTTLVDAGLTQADVDYWKGSVIVFSSGTLAGQSRTVTAFNPATDTLTFSPATTQAVSTHAYLLIPSTSLVDVASSTLATAASLSTVSGFVDTEVAAIKAKTDQLVFTVANQVDVNVLDWKSATAPAMTGDAFARLGAPAGASVSADVAAVKAVLPSALVSGRIDASVGAMANDVVTAAAIAADAIGSSELAASAVTEIQSGLSTLDAAGVRSAVGLASANLDTQIAALDSDVLSRLASSSYTAPPSASTIAQAVWDVLTSALTTVGSIGKLLVTNIDAAISSRSTYAGTDTAGTTTLLSRLGSPVGASISADIAAVKAVDDAVKAKTDNLPADPADASDIAAEFASLQSHGDSTWATATGFATPTNVSDGTTTVTDAIAALTIPSAAANAAALLAEAFEGAETVQDFLRLSRAALYGKANGLAGTTVHYRDAADSKNRLTATVDGDGNRSAITTDAT